MLIKSSNKKEVESKLATLKIGKTYSIQEIVDTVNQITNHKSGTTDAFKMLKGVYEGHGTIALDDLYVDMTYQRRIRLAKIINKLVALGGFDKDVAGSIDVAYRPCDDKYFVWDGLRRCLMVGICGGSRIVAALHHHPAKFMTSECRMAEARFFKVRNADSEKMSFEEVFKSKVAYNEERAMAQLSLLKKMNLDVEGLNPAGIQLGGLRAFDSNYGKIDDDKLIMASKLYQHAWNSEPQILGYGLMGLATLLNEPLFEENYVYEDVRDTLRTYALNSKPKTLTNPRINSAPYKSVAYNFATKVLGDKNGLVQSLLDDEQIDLMQGF
tara:strand:+ start:151 stop:1128 length:978 start_codon:yes stop_codon:yes gene_type:complete